MTADHRHRVISTRAGSRLERALRRPVIWWTHDQARAERSRFVYQRLPQTGRYVLSPLGLLHGLIGLTLDVQ